MSINEFEHGKTRIMAEARDALRRIGVEYHCVMFDVHGSQPVPGGATLTVTAEGNSVSGWFPADELEDSRDRVARADIRQKIAGLVAGVKRTVT
jgi:P2-related tail formation protein